MDSIIINQTFTVRCPIPESTSGDTVTYTIYGPDKSVFASGNAVFVGGINWQCTFTPTSLGPYSVEFNDQTLVVKWGKDFTCVNVATTSGIPVTEVVTLTDTELLAKVNEAIAARMIGGAVQSYSIQGRNLQYCTLEELWKMRRNLENAIAAQGGSGRTYAKFKNADD